MFPRDYFAGDYFAPTYFPPVIEKDDEEEEEPCRYPVRGWTPRDKPLDDDEFLMLFWD